MSRGAGGSAATSCPARGRYGAGYQGPRTAQQSQETEIPSPSEQRKLKTKCFFLKSRKEAASVESGGGRGPPPTRGSQEGGVGLDFTRGGVWDGPLPSRERPIGCRNCP